MCKGEDVAILWPIKTPLFTPCLASFSSSLFHFFVSSFPLSKFRPAVREARKRVKKWVFGEEMCKKLEGSYRERFGYYSLSVLEGERELSISFLTLFFSLSWWSCGVRLGAQVLRIVVLLPSLLWSYRRSFEVLTPPGLRLRGKYSIKWVWTHFGSIVGFKQLVSLNQCVFMF